MNKPFFFFILLITTVILPVNVFGFNQIDDKATYVKQFQKDPITLHSITSVIMMDSYTDFEIHDTIIQTDDLNLRWEPVSNFLGDDF